MSDTHDSAPTGRAQDADGTRPTDAGEEQLEAEGAIDGVATESLEPREEQELRQQLRREMRFDGFEQGIQG